MDLTMLSLPQCENYIDKNYILPMIAFLRGERQSIATQKEFLDCRTAVNEQCDAHDRSSQVHQLYTRKLDAYFAGEIHPNLRGKFGEMFLLELVRQWDNYTIFTMLLNRLFDYININYVRSNFLDAFGKQCQKEFKNRVIIGLEAELQAAIADQITRDRNKEAINRDALKTAIGVYVDLGKEGE